MKYKYDFEDLGYNMLKHEYYVIFVLCTLYTILFAICIYLYTIFFYNLL